jgi:Uma2 family endonuclease
MNLSVLIGRWLMEHTIGRLYHAPFDVVLSDFDVVEPDLLYISNERRREIVTAQHVRGGPELVIEIGSPGTRRRDETLKHDLYERSGVVEYWLVDVQADVVRVYRREREQFARAIDLSRHDGEVLKTALLPGLELPLDGIFRE